MVDCIAGTVYVCILWSSSKTCWIRADAFFDGHSINDDALLTKYKDHAFLLAPKVVSPPTHWLVYRYLLSTVQIRSLMVEKRTNARFERAAHHDMMGSVRGLVPEAAEINTSPPYTNWIQDGQKVGYKQPFWGSRRSSLLLVIHLWKYHFRPA